MPTAVGIALSALAPLHKPTDPIGGRGFSHDPSFGILSACPSARCGLLWFGAARTSGLGRPWRQRQSSCKCPMGGRGASSPSSATGTNMTTTAPAPIFDHLLRLSDWRGTLTHARSAEPLPEYGYSTEDLAWVLVVSDPRSRSKPNTERSDPARIAILNDPQALTGACRNRMDDSGDWVDEPALEDFMGDNDAGVPMRDPETGRGYDALHADGVDSNQVRRHLGGHLYAQHARRYRLCGNDFGWARGTQHSPAGHVWRTHGIARQRYSMLSE